MTSLIKVSIALTLSFILFLGNPFAASASAHSGSIDLNNLEGNPDVEIEELTYDQMINELSESKGMSIEEAKEKYPDLNVSNQNEYGTENSSCGQFSPNKIRVSLNVSPTYIPTLDIYAWLCNSGSVTWIEKLADVDINRHGGWSSKEYVGTILAEVTTNISIWWKVNGDFYDTGTTTITGSVKAGGLVWEGSGSFSYQTNHYRYFNRNGTIFTTY